VQLREYVALAPHTTLGLGGKARYFVECGSEDEVRAALSYAAERQLPTYILGGGSNVVFLDAGFPGLILRITIGGTELHEGTSPEVRVGAGVDWDTLVQSVVQRGWTGVECLSGIPGTVGGTPIQNVGAYGQEVAQTITEARVYDRREKAERALLPEDCGFAYRDSRLTSIGGGADVGLVAQRGEAREPQPLGSGHQPELQGEVAALRDEPDGAGGQRRCERGGAHHGRGRRLGDDDGRRRHDERDREAEPARDRPVTQ